MSNSAEASGETARIHFELPRARRVSDLSRLCSFPPHRHPRSPHPRQRLRCQPCSPACCCPLATPARHPRPPVLLSRARVQGHRPPPPSSASTIYAVHLASPLMSPMSTPRARCIPSCHDHATCSLTSLQIHGYPTNKLDQALEGVDVIVVPAGVPRKVSQFMLCSRVNR